MNYTPGFPGVVGRTTYFRVFAFPSGSDHADAMNLGSKIKRLRNERGWSQPELATLVGTTPKSIGNWENNRHHPREKLPILEKVFGVALDDESPADDLDRVEMALAASELVSWRQDEVRSVYRRNLEQQRDERAARGSA